MKIVSFLPGFKKRRRRTQARSPMNLANLPCIFSRSISLSFVLWDSCYLVFTRFHWCFKVENLVHFSVSWSQPRNWHKPGAPGREPNGLRPGFISRTSLYAALRNNRLVVICRVGLIFLILLLYGTFMHIYTLKLDGDIIFWTVASRDMDSADGRWVHHRWSHVGMEEKVCANKYDRVVAIWSNGGGAASSFRKVKR
jgi:hypothetical protein